MHHVVTRSERVGHGESIVVFFFLAVQAMDRGNDLISFLTPPAGWDQRLSLLDW